MGYIMKNDNAMIAVSNMLWRLFERIGVQGITFVVSVILARLLSPSDYGLLAIVSVFMAMSGVLVDSGFAVALVQKEDADSVDYSTVFFFNIFSCFLVYILLFFTSPIIANYYGNSLLTQIIRVVGIGVLLAPIKNLQQAYVAKNMLFRKFFFSTIGGTLVSAIVGVYLAYTGRGVWALVFQQLANSTVDMIVLWFTVKWRPTLEFSFERLTIMFGYGSKLLLSSIIHTIYDNLRQLLIGKVYTSEDLAFYSKGKHIPDLIMTNLNVSIESVLFPVLVRKKNNNDDIKKAVQMFIRGMSCLVWPIMLGIAAVGDELIEILFTKKWLFSVPYLRIFCICYAFQPIHTANLCAIKAIGRSDVFLKMEVIKKIVGVVIVFVAIKFGVLAVALSSIIYNFFAQFVNTYPNKMFIGYGYREQLKDIMPFASFALLMYFVLTLGMRFEINMYVSVVLQILTGVAVYSLCCLAFERDTIRYVWGVLKKLTNKE